MYTRVLNTWSKFRSSFWFVPTLLMVLATGAAFGMIYLDETYGKRFVNTFPVLELSPGAARSILSTIVGAMVSTTGVVFSITIVALSLASSQFGSRLIRTYRNRPTTHFTLGIFVSTSLFCILVLASIREIDGQAFVPAASVVVGIMLTVVCLATLVYYIHDMSLAIQAPNVIQHSADDLDEAIERLFPAGIGEHAEENDAGQFDESALESAEEKLGECLLLINCGKVGYLQAMEDETIMNLANQESLTIRFLARPGDFLFNERPLVEIWRHEIDPERSTEEFREDISKSIQDSLIVGPERTHLQDIRHAFNELVDIAVRALSPGVNDPFTAVNCVDRIHAALMTFKKRELPSKYRLSEDGKLRVIALPVSFEECVAVSLDVILQYASDDSMVSNRIAVAKDWLSAQ
ncbi:DUF2254 domain-containing protein [Mariniblastus fucicola]|uniref:DUF2254 domain-containing protein n=1 Tax=Mariniblastus fucicola TaxID=980251 RepID=A0A5B9PD99_9BACT|nr:DUF2254 domain-containing protein [Mariniblastus fucicola]QEG24667.1 hypothetical protein MFFC18_45880 [Mariniblastus fucicola]